MLDAKVAQLLNEQVNKEFYSAYLYLDFSIYYEEEGLDGFANWYKIQAQEERDHAMLMVQYLQNNGGKVTLEAIAKPDRELTSRLRVLELGLEHERYVTGLIHTLYEAAYSAKDFRTMQFLDWFVKEQGEEEKNAEDLIKKMKLYGEDAKGCICSTARWPPGSTPPPLSCCDPNLLCAEQDRNGSCSAPLFPGRKIFLDSTFL